MSGPTEAARIGIIRFKAEQLKLRRAAEMADAATKRFRDFIPIAWPIVDPSKPFVHNWHIDAIADHMQAVADGQIKQLLINVPPGTAKSLIVAVLFPAWMWTPGRNPTYKANFYSYDADLASRDSVKCRDLLKSTWYKEVFKPDWQFKSDQDVKTYYVNTRTGFRMSSGVEGKGTGWRGDGIFIDDPLNARERASDKALASVIDWFDNVIFNRLTDMRTGVKVIIMQRLGDRDLSGHVLRNGGYDHLMIPMEYDPTRSKVTCIGWSDPRTQRGDLMFPKLFPREVVDDIKVKEATFAGQYQQSPNTEGGGIIKAHLWRYWKPKGLDLAKVRIRMPDGTIREEAAVDRPERFDIELQSWDLAFKSTDTTDFVCGQVQASRGAERYILKQVRGRMGFTETISAIRQMTGENPDAQIKLIEDKANGPAVIDSLKKEITGMVAVNPEGGKIDRAYAASPELESRNWFLPHPEIAPWVGNPENPTERGFLAETILFPNGANDDQVDAWSQGATRFQKEMRGMVFTASESDVRMEHPEISEKWPRIGAVYEDWKSFSAIWIVRQPETGQHIVYSEFATEDTDLPKKIAALKSRGQWLPISAGTLDREENRKSAWAMSQKLATGGVRMIGQRVVGEVEIIALRDAFSTRTLRVADGCKAIFGQYRMYRRDKNGKLPIENCGLIQALATAWATRASAKLMMGEKPVNATVHRGRAGSLAFIR